MVLPGPWLIDALRAWTLARLLHLGFEHVAPPFEQAIGHRLLLLTNGRPIQAVELFHDLEAPPAVERVATDDLRADAFGLFGVAGVRQGFGRLAEHLVGVPHHLMELVQVAAGALHPFERFSELADGGHSVVADTLRASVCFIHRSLVPPIGAVRSRCNGGVATWNRQRAGPTWQGGTRPRGRRRSMTSSFLPTSPRFMRRGSLGWTRRRIAGGLTAVVVAFVSVLIVSGGQAEAASSPPKPVVRLPAAKAAVVVDAGTGAVLAASNDRTPVPVASAIKIFTALVVQHRVKPADAVPISARAASMPFLKMSAKAGQRWKADGLMHALLLASANDAAVALAERAGGGTTAGYQRLFRSEAKTLHLQDGPTLQDPAGLDDEFSVGGGNLISARDLAIVARAFLRQPDLASIVKLPEYRFRGWRRTSAPSGQPRPLHPHVQGSDRHQDRPHRAQRLHVGGGGPAQRSHADRGGDPVGEHRAGGE